MGLALTTALDPLVRIHKRIIRIITNSSFLSQTNPLFQKLNFLKLKDIVKLEIAKIMFFFNKSSAKNEFQTIISIIQKHHYKTRLAAKQNYFQPGKRTVQFSSVQSFFISATCRTKYLHQRNYTTEKGTCNKTKQRCNMQKLNKLH